MRISIQIFGEFSSIAGITTRISPTRNVQCSLSSLGCSEASLKDGPGSVGSSFGDLSRIPFPPVPGQSTPTSSPSSSDTQPLINIHKEFNEQDLNHDVNGGVENKYYSHRDSLEVPARKLSTPYNRHRDAEFHSKLASDSDTTALEVSLDIPDHPDNFEAQATISSHHTELYQSEDHNMMADDKPILGESMEHNFSHSIFNSEDRKIDTAENLIRLEQADEEHLQNADGKMPKVSVQMKLKKKLSAGQIV